MPQGSASHPPTHRPARCFFPLPNRSARRVCGRGRVRLVVRPRRRRRGCSRSARRGGGSGGHTRGNVRPLIVLVLCRRQRAACVPHGDHCRRRDRHCGPRQPGPCQRICTGVAHRSAAPRAAPVHAAATEGGSCTWCGVPCCAPSCDIEVCVVCPVCALHMLRRLTMTGNVGMP